ncbi:MAG: PilZ domain-containing protein [Desulfomonilaceae bacterium]|nr:PilZ domain-containing protein [Desulfomonilaceae bacterium]
MTNPSIENGTKRSGYLTEREIMSVEKVDGRTLLEDIRAGLDDRELMIKHGLSGDALQRLYKDLVAQGLLKRMDRYSLAPPERTVNAGEVIADLRSGMSMSDLMRKHDLSMRGLQGVVSILVDTGAIGRDEIYGELFREPDAELPDGFRQLHRFYIDFEIPIYVASRPEVQGRIRDITDDGIGTVGLKAEVDRIETLVVLGDALGDVAPFELEARCRWCERREDTGEYASGFQITYVSDKNRAELTRLIGLLTFTA